jgi:hypothetical protein
MGWRRSWPNIEEALDRMDSGRSIDVGIGAVEYAPDYVSKGDGESVRLTPGTGPSLFSLTPDEIAILGKVRNLRPGQELRITRCQLHDVPQTMLTDVTEDPA